MRKPFLNAGLAMGLLSGATFGTSGSFATSLIAAGWTPGAVVTARVAIAALLLTPLAILQLRSRTWNRSVGRIIVLYGLIAVAGAQLCFFNAISHLSVGVALLLEYSGILLVVGWGWIRHGIRPRSLTLISGAVALGGLVLVLDLTGSHHVDPVGIFWGFGAAVGLAAYFVVTAESSESVPPLTLAWGGLTVGSVALGIACLTEALQWHASGAEVTLAGGHVPWIVPVLGLSIVAAVVAYLAGIAAVRLLGAKLASFLGLTEVLAAVGLAWLLLGQRLDGIQLVGGALVVAGIALVRLDEMRDGEVRRNSSRETDVVPQAVTAASRP